MGCSNFASSSSNSVINQQTRDNPGADTDQNNQIFQTLLCSQLLKAKNPHILSNGALNDQTEVDDDFLHSSRLLTTQYNALDFRQKKPEEEREYIAPNPI